MSDPDIVELRRLYEKADSLAREVGELRGEVQIPAINELRYAGHHLLQSIDDAGTVEIETLRKAKSHCERAMYEAAEAGIMFCLDSIKEFREDYRDVVVSDVIHDYPQRCAWAQQTLDMVVKGRSDRDSVESHVDAYMEEFRVVRGTLRLFDASRDDLNAIRARQVQDHRRFVIRVLVMLLGILVTLVLGIVALL